MEQSLGQIKPGETEAAVRRYIRGTNFRIVGIMEFAPGILGVLDTDNEYAAYFNVGFWGPKAPALWGDSLYPPGLEGTGLGVLEAIGSMPSPNDFYLLREFAERNLKSLEGRHVWYLSWQRYLPVHPI